MTAHPYHSPKLQNVLATHRLALRKQSLSLSTSHLICACPHLYIFCLLFIVLNLCHLNTRPRLGGNNSHPQSLSVLSTMCSLKIQQVLGLH